MTQFLLSAAPEPSLEPGYEATPLAGIGHLVEAAGHLFPGVATVWEITPSSEEMDAMVDSAREQVLSGGSIEETELGRALTLLATQGDFALFWAGDYDNLPTVSSLEDLWPVIESQLRTHGGNWELYVRLCWGGGE